jgi:hypothetical protein
MHISLERSGGVTGIPLNVSFDTDFLPSETVSQLRQLIEDSGLFELPAVISSSVQVDRFQYKISVQVGDRYHTVTVREPVPDALKPLIDRLIAI